MDDYLDDQFFQVRESLRDEARLLPGCNRAKPDRLSSRFIGTGCVPAELDAFQRSGMRSIGTG
jgi:hypothetical protein